MSRDPTDPVLQTTDNSNPQQGTTLGDPNAAQVMPAERLLGTASNNKIPPIGFDPRKLFVGGLPSDITDDEFRFFFGQFGEILDSFVMFDRETRRSRGFGFVTFNDPEVAKSLLKRGNGTDGIGRLVMRGKACELKPAEPKEAGARIGRKPHGERHNQFFHMHPFHFAGPAPFQTADEAMFGHPFPHYQGYPADYSFGFPGYMAPMHYYPDVPAHPAGPGVPPAADFVGPVPAYYAGPYLEGPMPPPAITHAIPVPVAHPQAYAFIPFMPPPPMTTPPSPSVMQPAAPGIPMQKDEASPNSGLATACMNQDQV